MVQEASRLRHGVLHVNQHGAMLDIWMCSAKDSWKSRRRAEDLDGQGPRFRVIREALGTASLFWGATQN